MRTMIYTLLIAGLMTVALGLGGASASRQARLPEPPPFVHPLTGLVDESRIPELVPLAGDQGQTLGYLRGGDVLGTPQSLERSTPQDLMARRDARQWGGDRAADTPLSASAHDTAAMSSPDDPLTVYDANGNEIGLLRSDGTLDLRP